MTDDLTNRAELARAITLIESTRPDHAKEAQAMLERILPKTGKSLRIGITGVPGAGKSTFIEAFGLHAIEQGHKVAVLAVDPSSTRTGGSILGDKTRMAKLAQHDKAFIRPSPTGGILGGIARRTRESAMLCEAAGYDIIIVETVGVGQSETEVADIVDMFILMLLPGSGDEMQGIKKGIVELADLIVVNKADGDLLVQAKRVRSDYSSALKLLHPPHEGWMPRAITCSSVTGEGINDVWKAAEEFQAQMRSNNQLEKIRARQAEGWMWKEIREALIERFMDNPNVQSVAAQVIQDARTGKITPLQAAHKLLDSNS